MQKAFTMIELVFVIVIIGILSAVAIPKLAASRNDALGANIVASLANCINEAGNEYMMQGSFNNLTQVGNSTENCKKARECFGFSEIDNEGKLTVSKLVSSDQKCIVAQEIADNNLLSGTSSINF